MYSLYFLYKIISNIPTNNNKEQSTLCGPQTNAVWKGDVLKEEGCGSLD
jgi:hypothetical protein